MGKLIGYAISLVVLWRFTAMVVRYFVRPRSQRDRKLYEMFILLAILAEFPTFNLAFDESMDFMARRMGIYATARRDFLQSESAKTALGGSLRIGWPIKIAGEIEGGDGNATLSIPVGGEKGMAALEVSSVKKHGVWKIVDLHLTPHGTQENIQIEH